MAWWIWILIGLGLLGIEAGMPGGFFFLFFGISGLAVGILAALGIGGPLWMQWALFSALALAALAVLRKPLQAKLNINGANKHVDKLTRETAIAQTDMAPDQIGKAELRGTTWTARNASEGPIVTGQRLKVDRVDGLTLFVRPE
jgi:membrane protein implicated in regulation of membrane protease activity